MTSEQNDKHELRITAVEFAIREIELTLAQLPVNAGGRLTRLLDTVNVWLTAEATQQKQIDDIEAIQQNRHSYTVGQINCLKRYLDNLAIRLGLDPSKEGFYDDNLPRA